MKKIIGLIMVLCLTLTMFAACGASSSASSVAAESSASKAETGEPVEISFMHIWPELAEIMDKNIADFEAENPDIKVNTTVIPWDQLTKTLQTSFAAGDAPDISVAWLDRMGGFKAIDACLDITSYMTDNNNEWKDSFVPSALSLGTVGDAICGVPFRTTCTILCYNKTMLEENGWELPKTLEEFEALNEKVVAAGLTPLLAPGNPEGFQVASLIRTFAENELYKTGKLQSQEYLSGYLSDVSEEYALAGERARNWLNNGWIGKDSLALKREEAQAQFFSNKALFFFANNNELASLRGLAEEAGIEIGFTGFPTPEGLPNLLFNLGVDGFMVYSKTEHPEECIRFLKYMTSAEVQSMWAKETLSVMGNQTISYDDADQKAMADIFAKGETYRIRFTYPQGSLLTDEAIAAADFMADSSMTPEQYGKNIAALKQACIDENGTK